MTDEDELTPEKFKAIARKLTRGSGRGPVVEVRGKHRRNKIDPAEFATAAPEAIPPKRSKAPETYEYFRYDPEYGAPEWRVNVLVNGKRKQLRRFPTEEICMVYVDYLRSSGASVTRRAK
jgi:hypothetical protein